MSLWACGVMATQKFMQKWEIKDAIFSLIKSNAVHLILHVIVHHSTNWELSSMWYWVNFQMAINWKMHTRNGNVRCMRSVSISLHLTRSLIESNCQCKLQVLHTHSLDNVVVFPFQNVLHAILHVSWGVWRERLKSGDTCEWCAWIIEKS